MLSGHKMAKNSYEHGVLLLHTRGADDLQSQSQCAAILWLISQTFCMFVCLSAHACV